MRRVFGSQLPPPPPPGGADSDCADDGFFSPAAAASGEEEEPLTSPARSWIKKSLIFPDLMNSSVCWYPCAYRDSKFSAGVQASITRFMLEKLSSIFSPANLHKNEPIKYNLLEYGGNFSWKQEKSNVS